MTKSHKKHRVFAGGGRALKDFRVSGETRVLWWSVGIL